jgi:hypothetical protein
VNDEFSPAAAGLICTHLHAHMDLPGCPRRCPRPPGQHELNPRSRANSFHTASLRLSPPRLLTSILCRRAYLKHGGANWFRNYFSRLTPQNVHIAERQSSEASCRALVLRRIYQTYSRSCSTTSPSTPSAVGAREASAVDHSYQGTVLASSSHAGRRRMFSKSHATPAARLLSGCSQRQPRTAIKILIRMATARTRLRLEEAKSSQQGPESRFQKATANFHGDERRL